MRRRNMREVRRCGGGERRRRLAAVLVLAGGLLLSGCTAAEAAPVHNVPHVGTPIAGIYFYHPILQSVPRTPPLDTLIQFRTEVYQSVTPEAFSAIMHLMWWHKGGWVEILPPVSYGLDQLPGLGNHAYLSPPATWTCMPGAYFVKVHLFARVDGSTYVKILYFPWAGFNRKKPGKGNVLRPPSLRQSWHTKCQGSDAVIG